MSLNRSYQLGNRGLLFIIAQQQIALRCFRIATDQLQIAIDILQIVTDQLQIASRCLHIAIDQLQIATDDLVTANFVKV